MRSQKKSEAVMRLIGLFVGLVFITFIAFFLSVGLLKPEDGDGLLVSILLVISLQISFITAYVITQKKQVNK